MSKLTPQQRITKAHVTLMRSAEFCLLSGILMMGRSEVKAGVPTACTNGRDKFYGEAFIAGLNDKQLNFLVAHENYHVMFKHMTTWKKLADENARLANMAMDYVINQLILDADRSGRLVEFIEGGCYDLRFKGMDTKQVYDLLKSEDAGEDEGGQGSLDEHDWADAAELSDGEVEELEAAVDQAIRQGVIVAGKMGGNVPREVQGLTAPKVDWREQLADFIRSACQGRDMSTWRKPNRRYLAQGDYRPSSYSEALGDIVIAIDTSGSVGGAELTEFLSEVQALVIECQPASVKLLYWDTDVVSAETYDPGQYESLASTTKPAGGGGTNIGCVFDWIEAERMDNLTCCVILSDLCTPWCSAPAYPVLFACNTSNKAPFGVTVTL